MSEVQAPFSAREKLALARQEMTRVSLHANAPVTSSIPGQELGGILMLSVMDIKLYDKNPRTTDNPLYEEIKASIRVRRCLDSPLVVTQRPGETHYMIAKGGNTRLRILQELLEETGDACFGMQQVMTTPWKKESDVQIAHLIENSLRADISFWDKAIAVLSVCEEIERESGQTLSQRQQTDALKNCGYDVSRSLIQIYHYACKRLTPVGQFLSNNAARELQPALNELVLLAGRFDIAEEALFSQTLDPVMEQYVVTLQGDAEPVFDANLLIKKLHEAVAPLIGTTVAQLGGWLATQKVDPGVTAVTLQQCNRLTLPAMPVSNGTPPDLLHPQATLNSTSPQLNVQILIQAQTLANAGGVADCLMAHERAPCFFYMEPDQGNETALDPYLREATWWVLAQLSGQLYREVALGLPAQSRWQPYHAVNVNETMQLVTTANGHYDIHTQQPMIYADYLPLLLWHEQGTGNLLTNLLHNINALREQQPERFGFCIGNHLFSRKESPA